MELNESQALKDVENSLRNYIALVLNRKFGESWITKCGVTEERISKCEERREEEMKRHGSGFSEDRLIYYSDFYDLRVIINKHWDPDFKSTFKDKKQFDTFFAILSDFRNPEAHRRDLITFQKHLVLGIAGHFRNLIVTARSMDAENFDYFPQIESVNDNYGNICREEAKEFNTILHPGDVLEFTLKATDPEGGKIFYRVFQESEWQESNVITLHLLEKHISVPKHFFVQIKSERKYHKNGEMDDRAGLFYKIVPEKK